MGVATLKGHFCGWSVGPHDALCKCKLVPRTTYTSIHTSSRNTHIAFGLLFGSLILSSSTFDLRPSTCDLPSVACVLSANQAAGLSDRGSRDSMSSSTNTNTSGAGRRSETASASPSFPVAASAEVASAIKSNRRKSRWGVCTYVSMHILRVALSAGLFW